MTKQEVIDKFHLYTSDSTEMSVSEESDLFEKIVQKIAMDRPWELLKSPATGTILNSGTVYYITLPTDFGYLIENNQATDNSVGITNNASPKVIFVGSDYTPYQVVNFSDRRQHRNSNNAYLDLANNRIVFTGNPTGNGSTYEFDYIKFPAILALGDTLVFPPSRFGEMVSHGMAIDEFMIEQFPKVQSYAPENQAKFNSYMADLAYYNSMLLNN